MAITFRDEKNAPLTHQEVDANFRSFFFTASFSENNLSLQRKDGVTVNVPVGGQAFANFQANGGSIGNVYIANSQVTGSRMILDLLQGQFYDKTKGPGSVDGTLSSDEWYIDFDPAASAPYFVHFGSNFAISSSGFLHASGAIIEGNITASSGLIGGFNITPDSIHGPTTLGVPSFFISGSAGATGYFISSSKFNVKGNGDITGSAVLFSGGKIAGWDITNSQIKKSTNIILDATNESISIKNATFGHPGIQLQYNSGTSRFYVGDGTGSFVKFDGTNVEVATSILAISASNIEISSVEASMSLGAGIKLLGSSSTIEVGQGNKVKLVSTATDAFLIAGSKTTFGTNDAGIIIGMDASVPTLDITKDASNYVRFNSTSGIDIKTDTFKLDTTNFDIDSSTQRLNIFNSASAELIRLGEISDAASDLYGIKIFNGLGTGSANTIAMFGQQGNKIGGWEVTDSQIRTVPSAGFGEAYGSTENGLIIHSSGRLESSNFVTNVKGWRIDTLGNGSAEFENMRIRGTLRTTVFEKESVNVVGGQLMIANSTTIEPLRSETGTIIAGSSSYAANAVTFSVANVSGFKEGEVLKIKSVGNTGFTVEYLYVTGSKRYSSDSSIVYETGSLDPDGLFGEIYVGRGYGGAAPSVSSSLTAISSNISTTSETSINVNSNSGLLLQSIIKIGTERLKVTGIEGTVLTVIRGYHDSPADSHVEGSTLFLIDTDKEFLSGLVSSPVAYNEGQVIVSTGVYNPSLDISSGYIMMNANPRDISTPYMDIVERTGSGVYDLQLRSRLGDLSGLSSGYLYGNNEPGFGLYTENGFFKGAITAETGSIAGILHVATVAGGLETGQKISIGRDVSGTNDGIYVNNNNYWYTDGAWKVGGSSNFISLDNFTNGNLVVKTQTFTLDTPTFMISSSLNSGTLTAGVSASAITNTAGEGIYLDGTGKFRVGTPTSGNNYIYWDGSTLNIKGAIDITGGTGATSADLDAITGSLSSSLATQISASDATLSGSIATTSDTLDGKIFTDSSGRAVRPPTASAEGLYMASTNLGFYKDGEWKTYMDNQGDFFLTGSAGNKLAWDSSTGVLEIAGAINITGGNAATTDYVTGSTATLSGSLATTISSSNATLTTSISSSTATLQDGIDSANNVIAGKVSILRQNSAPSSASRTVGDMWIDSDDGNKVYVWNGTVWAATPDGTYDQTVLINNTSASLSSSVALDIFTDSTGKLVSTPSTSSAGLYLGDDALGFYSASEWRTYMANNGNFFLTGSDGNYLAWDGGALTIQGSINITGGNAATSASVADAQTAAETFASASSAVAINSGSAAAAAAQTAAEATAAAALDTATGSLETTINTLSGSTSASLATQAETNAALTLVQDGLNSIFRQNEPPATASRHQGDVWIDQNDGEKLYIFSASVWTPASDTTYDQETLITNTSSSVALDTFTDSTGRIVATPNPSTAGLYLGDSNLGFYSASAWQTYMADNGNFFLTGSDSNYLKWDGNGLTIAGTINIVGGNAATTDYVTGSTAGAIASGSAAATTAATALTASIASATSTATAASTTAAESLQTATSASTAATAAQGTADAATGSAATAIERSVDADGKITFNPSPSGEGLFMNSTNLGFYSGSAWGAYLSASGEFYLTGSGNSGMSWDGSDLSIDGTVTAVAGAIGGISIAAGKLHTGTGTHGNGNTGFYIDSGSNFSLGDKLIWDGTDLTVNGSITVTNSTDFASQAELDAATGSAADQFAAAVASGSAAAAEAVVSGSASAASVQGNLDVATGSLQTYADGAVTDITGSISSAQSTADAATGSAATVQSNLDAATGSLQTYADAAVTAITSSIPTLPTTYDFGPDANQTLASLGSTPTASGLYLGSDKLGFYSASQWRTYMGNDGTFILSGSGDDSLIWNGTSLRIGSPGVGPSLTYQFSGSLNDEVFDSSISSTLTVTRTIEGNTFINDTDGWDEGFHTKAVFDRNDGPVFEWDVVVNHRYPATMIGLFKENPSSYSFSQQHHTVYLQDSRIQIYENGTHKANLTSTGTWPNDSSVHTLLRISIQLLPTGASYRVFKNGDFINTLASYNSVGNGISNQYVRPGASIHYDTDATDPTTLFNRMSAGSSLGTSTKISGNVVQTGAIASANFAYTSGNFADAGTDFNLESGNLRSKEFSVVSGNAFFSGNISGASGTIGGINLESNKLYNGAGTHSAADTGFYIDSSSNFSLGNKLTWDGTNLAINGSITVSNSSDFITPSQLDTATGSLQTYADGAVTDITGSISTAQSTANTATSSAATAQSTADAATGSAATALDRSVDASGKITFNPTPSGQGLFMNSTNLGFYSGSAWGAYLSASGEFYLTGSNSSGMSWDGSDLSIDGTVTAVAGEIGGWTIDSTSMFTGTKDTSAYTAGGITISSTSGGSIHAKQFYIDTSGNANFKGSITGATGDFAGNLNGASITGGTIVIGATYISDPRYFRADTNGISLGGTTTTTGEFKVNTQGYLSAVSGVIGNWIIGTGGVLRDSANRIFLEPASKKIRISDGSADRIEISGVDIPAVSATKSVDLSLSAITKTHRTKRDSDSNSHNSGSDSGYTQSQINPVPANYTFGRSLTRAEVVTGGFAHAGGDLPVIIPIGENISMGSFSLQADNNSGDQSSAHNPYDKFIQTSLNYTHSLVYILEKETAGQHGGSSAFQGVSGPTTVTLGENSEFSGSYRAVALRKSELQGQGGFGNPFYSKTTDIKTHPTHGNGFSQQTINRTYTNQGAGTYRLKMIQSTTYSVNTRLTGTLNTGVSTANSRALTWTLSFSAYSALGTPVTIGTFTALVKMGLNGVQISGADGSVVLGEIAENGVANIFGNALVTGTLTANTSNLSDERLKDNIEDIDNPLALIGNLTPKSFRWKHNVNPDESRTDSYGFIAQQMTGSFSHLVNVQPKIGHIEDVLTVDQMPIVALNTAGIQQLIAKITSLETKVAELETAVSGSE